eukprot:365700-Chlamydomonas_euryale.AAC.6
MRVRCMHILQLTGAHFTEAVMRALLAANYEAHFHARNGSTHVSPQSRARREYNCRKRSLLAIACPTSPDPKAFVTAESRPNVRTA